VAVVTLKQLLEAGVHFGHQTRRWNPKMKPFIYAERNGIYIIDLQKTYEQLEAAYSFVRDASKEGKQCSSLGRRDRLKNPFVKRLKELGCLM